MQIDGPIPVDGDSRCHINIPAWDMQPEWEEYRVRPVAPARVFAGDEPPTFEQTVFLRFSDVMQARSVLGISIELEE